MSPFLAAILAIAALSSLVVHRLMTPPRFTREEVERFRVDWKASPTMAALKGEHFGTRRVAVAKVAARMDKDTMARGRLLSPDHIKGACRRRAREQIKRRR
eukprot:1407760-Prymnesium_polylepis.1